MPDDVKLVHTLMRSLQQLNNPLEADDSDPLPSKSGYEGDWDVKFATGTKSTMAFLAYHLFLQNRAVYFKIGDDLKLPWKPDPVAFQ